MSAAAGFARLLDIMLPGGGVAVAVSEAYFDESYDHRGPPILCVAGYAFRKSKAIAFSREWSKYLRSKGLPYFHMIECAHGNGVFKDRGDCDDVARELIRLTHKYAGCGIAVAVNTEEYARILGPRPEMPSAYAFALLAVVTHIQRWKERDGGGRISFFFEQGHQHQGDAHRFFDWLFDSPHVVARHGYTGHSFVPKETPGVHPADFLAWHWQLESKRARQPDRKPMRKDLIALGEGRPNDRLFTYEAHHLERLAELMREAEERRAEIIGEAERTGRLPAEWAQKYGVPAHLSHLVGEGVL